MSVKLTLRDNSGGFAAVAVVLVVLVVVAILGIGGYILKQKPLASTTNVSSSIPASPTVAPGTSASIDKITQQDAVTEAGADSSADSQANQTTTSSNSSVTTVGGSFDENTL